MLRLLISGFWSNFDDYFKIKTSELASPVTAENESSYQIGKKISE